MTLADAGERAEERSSRPLLRLLHTADLHLGEDYAPGRRLAGLRAVVDACLRAAADALIIAGDLFDNARVADSTVDDAYGELGRLSIPVLVTPGNHDALQPPSVFDRASPRLAGSHVHFLDDPAGSYAVIDELGLTAWARAMVDHHPGHNPLEGYAPRDDGNWQIVLAHGFYFPASQAPDRSSPLRQQHIAALACDYAALGHWHRFADVSSDGVAAFYPGSPSETGGSFAGVNLVMLDPAAGVSVDRIALEISDLVS